MSKFTPPPVVYVGLSWDLGVPQLVSSRPGPVSSGDPKLGPFRYALAPAGEPPHYDEKLRQFYKPVEFTTIEAVDCDRNRIDRERAIRLYKQSPESWCLQVRGPRRLRNGTDGTDFIVASASLDAAALRALRNAIDALLIAADGEEP